MDNKVTGSRSRHVCSALLLLTLIAQSACNRSAPPNANAHANTSNTASASNAPARNFDEEIARLEKEAEKNPGDGETLNALSQAYVRRANALRTEQKLREALRDYQSALRNNPDNEEAQKKGAEVAKQLEGEPTAENGEPAPLPITPNVTTGDDGQTEQPSPTPAKKKKP
jgi:tetratricopeptide (TPR) repeat protein